MVATGLQSDVGGGTACPFAHLAQGMNLGEGLQVQEQSRLLGNHREGIGRRKERGKRDIRLRRLGSLRDERGKVGIGIVGEKEAKTIMISSQGRATREKEKTTTDEGTEIGTNGVLNRFLCIIFFDCSRHVVSVLAHVSKIHAGCA